MIVSKRFFLMVCCICCAVLWTCHGLCEEDVDWSIDEIVIVGEDGEERERETIESVNPAREDLINRIIENGRMLYEKANGKYQRAHYAGDIYVCKNFTTYLFRENRDDFRMAEYPNVPLVIPDNLPKDKCAPYQYGFLWKDVPASEGNPFYVAAQFRYDTSLSKAENLELAVKLMEQVQRGDYFQMSASYEYGVGAHSAIMIADYNPADGYIHWMDSNMLGQKRNGIRYALVQYDAKKTPDWWAQAFCVKGRGATIYRLRDDIVYASGAQ